MKEWLLADKVGLGALGIAAICFTIEMCRYWYERTPRFICPRCGRKHICLIGIPNVCPCGTDREGLR